MATSNLEFNSGLRHGGLLRSALTNLENGNDSLNDVISCMQLMIDGNGSDASHFNEVMTRFGFSSLANSKAAWDELNSLKFKLNTNDSVTDVKAAMDQAFAKFR